MLRSVEQIHLLDYFFNFLITTWPVVRFWQMLYQIQISSFLIIDLKTVWKYLYWFSCTWSLLCVYRLMGHPVNLQLKSYCTIVILFISISYFLWGAVPENIKVISILYTPFPIQKSCLQFIDFSLWLFVLPINWLSLYTLWNPFWHFHPMQ